MKKAPLIAIGIIIIAALILGFFALNSYIYQQKQGDSPSREAQTAADHKNISYEIDGNRVQLTSGVAEIGASPTSFSKVVVTYFGNEVKADLNADSNEDIAFLLVKETGGSGTFYYVVAALGSEQGYRGTNAILLGDRIAPQTTEFRNGEIIVNYADRKLGEPMTAEPSVGVSRYLKVSDNKLIEIVGHVSR